MRGRTLDPDLVLTSEQSGSAKTISSELVKGAPFLRRWRQKELGDFKEFDLGSILVTFAEAHLGHPPEHRPDKILIVAQAKEGKLVVDSSGPSESWVFLSGSWWSSAELLEICVFGCNSTSCFEEYRLADKVSRFLGFNSPVEFYIGSRKGRRSVADLLRKIGRKIFLSSGVTDSLRRSIKDEYIKAEEQMLKSYRMAAGDRINLIFFRRQRNSLLLLEK